MFKKTILIISVFVLIVAGISFYGYFKADSVVNNVDNITKRGAEIEVVSPVFDFGIVKYGDVAEHVFKIKNKGNEPLQILKLSTSCGCTSATIADEVKVIQPGKEVDMLVTFDPAVHKDDSDLGELTRVIYIVSNDEKNPEIEAKITANVIKKNN